MVSGAWAGRWGAPLVVGIGAFLAARLAMLPGLGYWDTAELQTVAPIMGTAHPTGFPTYVLLGWLVNAILAPLGEPALRMNLLAALCVAVAAAVTVDLVRALSRSLAMGVVAGLGLALTDIAWAIGTQADAHALHLAFVAILLRLLVAWEARRRAAGLAPDGGSAGPAGPAGPTDSGDRYLVAAAAVYGLAMGNHSLTLLLGPPIGLFVLAVDPAILRRPGLVARCAGILALVVVLVFLELPLRAGPFRAPLVYGHPETWEGFWSIVLAEQFRGSLVDPLGDLGGKAADLAGRTVRSFGALAALIPVAFAATAVRHPRYALLTGLSTLITCLFAASYDNAEIGRYYLGPVLMAWTWIGVLGAAVLAVMTGSLDAPDRPAPAAAPARSSPFADPILALGLAAALLAPTVIELPERFERVDRSWDVAARRWVDRTLDQVAPNAVIVSWWSYSTPLWYAQHIEGRRPDIDVVDDRTRLDRALGDVTDVIDANLSVRPVYVIRIEPEEIAALAARYELEHLDGRDAGSLTRVVGRRETGS